MTRLNIGRQRGDLTKRAEARTVCAIYQNSSSGRVHHIEEFAIARKRGVNWRTTRVRSYRILQRKFTIAAYAVR